ncbi:hypothetical protein BV898_19336 [Hypsibius exemplaris]|uniref:Uncharacterized protein n=1 Tax=Hypsibius exemplaris TaxID=2072580 RepID=A0A9X6RNU5_HYPEX|nr:hypothetical protein BV898_19336 [Hypsibius exemplaris]
MEKRYVYPISQRHEWANPYTQSLETFRKNDATLQSVSSSDGGLQEARFCTDGLCEIVLLGVSYSLNKRKRWLLPELFDMAVEQLPWMDFTVSCLIQSMPPYRHPYTGGVHYLRPVFCQKWYSDLTDYLMI